MVNISDYASLFSPNNRQKPRFMALAHAVLSQVTDLQALILQGFPAARDPASATGSCLDAIGSLLNIARPAGAGDADYRRLLRARTAAHLWNGTNETLPAALSQAFPGQNARMIDNLDGTVTVTLSGSIPFPFSMMFPAPAGIQMITEI